MGSAPLHALELIHTPNIYCISSFEIVMNKRVWLSLTDARATGPGCGKVRTWSLQHRLFDYVCTIFR